MMQLLRIVSIVSVKYSQDGGWEMGFYGYEAGVEGPGVTLYSSETNNNLFYFVHVQRQVVGSALVLQPLHLLSVC